MMKIVHERETHKKPKKKQTKGDKNYSERVRAK